ncbi:MAG: roadblock/LC7 domain-containing protein [Candidatus Micrarchaeota archaeon]|nr:roadblock/LC7 domain-containing protein [Candidatus Micrarchaeota archaeon]
MGCLESSVPLAQKKAVIEKAQQSDTDGDGIPNIWKYTFMPQGDGRLQISKEIIIVGMQKNPEFEIQPAYKRDEQASSTYYDLLTNLATITLNCNYALEDVITVCGTEAECQSLCTSNVRCNNGLNKYPALNGTLYQTAVDFSNVKRKATALRAAIASKSQLSQADVDNILLQRDELTKAINRLLSDKAFDLGICSQNELVVAREQLVQLQGIYVEDESATKAQYYTAYSKFEITSRTSYLYDENAIIDADEIIPESFAARKSDITFLTVPPIYVSDSIPLTARYRVSFKKPSDTRTDFGYKVIAPPANWDLEMQKITYPSGTIRVLALENIGVYVEGRALFNSALAVLRTYVGFGFGLAFVSFIVLLIIYLVYTLLRLVYNVFISASRHEPIMEAVYRVAGYGGRGRKEFIIAAALAIIAGSYLLASAGEPKTDDVVVALATSTGLLLGVSAFVVGLVLLGFVIEDLVKARLLGERYVRAPVEHGIRKVVVEKEMRDELQKMRKDIMSLKESAAVAGVIFDAQRIDRFFAGISAAETNMSRGKLEEAELMLEKELRKEYTALHEMLSVSMDQEKVLEKMRADVEDEIDQLEQLYRKVAGYSIRVEKKDWRVEANRYAIIYSGQGFVAAKKYLDSLMDTIRQERSSIQARMSELERLMLTKFPCPVCSRTTTLASDRCESCGVPLEEGFATKENELRQELNGLSVELKAKKIARGDRLVASVETLLSHMRENVNAKQYNKAYELVTTIDEKMKYLREILGKTIAQEEELKQHIAAIGKYLDSIPALLAQAKENSIDVSAYEKRFAAFSSKEALAQLQQMPVEEAVTRSKELLDGYALIESELKNTLAKFMMSVSAFERVNELFTEVSTLITRGKGYGMSVEEYSKRLGALNVDSLISSIERNEVNEKELANTVSILSDMSAELGKKVSAARQFSEQLDAIDAKLHEAGTLVEVCKKNNLVPFEEMERLYATSTEPIRSRLERFGIDEIEHIKNDIISLNTRVDSILLTLRRKSEVLSAWPGWKSAIEGLLRKQERVDPAMLSTIPPEWRPWVVERFIAETDLPVALEGNTIVKLKPIKGISKSDLDSILKEMIDTQRIIGGMILRKDGLVISSNLPKGGDPESVAAMSAKAMQKAETASKALNKGDVNYVAFNAALGKQVIVRAGEQSLILAIIRPDEDLGFVLLAMKKAADRVKEVIDKL